MKSESGVEFKKPEDIVVVDEQLDMLRSVMSRLIAYHIEQVNKIKNNVECNVDMSLDYLVEAIQLLFDKAYYNLEDRDNNVDKKRINRRIARDIKDTRDENER